MGAYHVPTTFGRGSPGCGTWAQQQPLDLCCFAHHGGVNLLSGQARVLEKPFNLGPDLLDVALSSRLHLRFRTPDQGLKFGGRQKTTTVDVNPSLWRFRFGQSQPRRELGSLSHALFSVVITVLPLRAPRLDRSLFAKLCHQTHPGSAKMGFRSDPTTLGALTARLYLCPSPPVRRSSGRMPWAPMTLD